MAQEKMITWYIGTNDADTNKYIAMDNSEKSEIGIIKGIEEPLWQCTFTFVKKMKVNKANLNLKFNVYVKQGRNGQIRKHDFLFEKKKIELKLKK